MREGEVTTPSINPMKSTPAINNAHNGEDPKSTVVFSEKPELIQNSKFIPNHTLSFNTNPTPHQAASYSQYAYGAVHVDPNSGDWTDLRIPTRIAENPDAFSQNLQKQMQVAIARMTDAKTQHTKQIATKEDLEARYPDYIFTPSPHGLLCTAPNGRTDLASKLTETNLA